MFIKDLDFTVIRSKYSERHFSKDFKNKYKDKKWNATEMSFLEVLRRVFSYQETALVDLINFSQEDGCGIFKLDFAVAGENQSAKGSGNRLIFFLNNKNGLIEILLIYGKTHCSGKRSETQWIKEVIKDNFSKYKKYCV